jgi:hypothetical protein
MSPYLCNTFPSFMTLFHDFINFMKKWAHIKKLV